MTEDNSDMSEFNQAGMRWCAKVSLDDDMGQDGSFGVTTDDHGAWKRVKGKWQRIGTYGPASTQVEA